MDLNSGEDLNKCSSVNKEEYFQGNFSGFFQNIYLFVEYVAKATISELWNILGFSQKNFYFFCHFLSAVFSWFTEDWNFIDQLHSSRSSEKNPSDCCFSALLSKLPVKVGNCLMQLSSLCSSHTPLMWRCVSRTLGRTVVLPKSCWCKLTFSVAGNLQRCKVTKYNYFVTVCKVK